MHALVTKKAGVDKARRDGDSGTPTLRRSSDASTLCICDLRRKPHRDMTDMTEPR